MSVILTVPHAKCPAKRIDHFCDFGAEMAANDIEREMKNVKVEKFIGDEIRYDCDLNRIRCRETPWRKKVSRALKQVARRDDAMLIDVHSFYPGGFGKKDHEIVLLDNLPALLGKASKTLDKDVSPITIDLASHLMDNGVSTSVLKGIINDINDEAIELNMPYFYLMEFNESMSDARRKEIAKYISDWWALTLERQRNNKQKDLIQEYKYRATLSCDIQPIYYETFTGTFEKVNKTPHGSTIPYSGELVVIRDDLLCGGTKSRIVDQLLNKSPGYKEYVYVSNWYGGAQVALAVGVSRLNSMSDQNDSSEYSAIIFTRQWPEDSILPYVKLAKDHGAKYITINDDYGDNKYNNNNINIFEQAQKYVLENPRERYLVPNGFDSPESVELLSAIGKSIAKYFVEPFDEFWSVAATGTLTRAMQKAKLAKKYYSVNLFDGPIDVGNAKSIIYDKDIDVPAPKDDRPPFPSNLYYAKAWQECFDRFQKFPDLRIIFWNVM